MFRFPSLFSHHPLPSTLCCAIQSQIQHTYNMHNTCLELYTHMQERKVPNPTGRRIAPKTRTSGRHANMLATYIHEKNTVTIQQRKIPPHLPLQPNSLTNGGGERIVRSMRTVPRNDSHGIQISINSIPWRKMHHPL